MFLLVLGIAGIEDGFAQSRDVIFEYQEQPSSITINHVIWIWFENRESTQITAATAPFFTNFAAANVNLTNFYGVTHPSQPNYLSTISGSNQGILDNGHYTLPASNDNLAKQLNAAGKSWRVYAQGYPGNCSDVDIFNGGIDGPGVAGQYVRKHNPVISFESVRLDPAQCANIQPLANFDPTVNFAMVVPNMINGMHDGTTGQGDAFLAAFMPQVTSSPDWAHTLVVITFDEGNTNTNGGGHIYAAAAAPWLTANTVPATYNHYSLLRTTEQIFGLPFLGSAATAATMTELLPSPLATEVSVTGRVLTSTGRGVRNAMVSILSSQGIRRTVLTGPFGFYSLPNVVTGQSYTISVASRRFTYTSQTVSVNGALAGVDFIAL